MLGAEFKRQLALAHAKAAARREAQCDAAAPPSDASVCAECGDATSAHGQLDALKEKKLGPAVLTASHSAPPKGFLDELKNRQRATATADSPASSSPQSSELSPSPEKTGGNHLEELKKKLGAALAIGARAVPSTPGSTAACTPERRRRLPGTPPGRPPLAFPGKPPGAPPPPVREKLQSTSRFPGVPPGPCPGSVLKARSVAKQASSALPVFTGPAPPPGTIARRLQWQSIPPARALVSVWASLVKEELEATPPVSSDGSLDEDAATSIESGSMEGSTTPSAWNPIRLSLNYKRLTALFFDVVANDVKSDASTGTQILSRSVLRCVPPAITVLDAKRRQNVEICLKGLGLLDNLAPLLQTLSVESSDATDTTAQSLSPENLQVVISLYPTPEEERALLAAEKKVSSDASHALGKAERFLLTLLKIDGLRAKAECCLIRLSFAEEVESVLTKLRRLSTCLTTVTRSVEQGAFRALLGLVLRMGNYLNYGSRRGSASGFTIDSLALLRNVKSVDGSTTLLRMVAQIIDQQSCKRTGFWQELQQSLGSCQCASDCSFDDICAVVKQLTSKIRKVATATQSIKDETFKTVYVQFAKAADEKLVSLEAELRGLEQQLLGLSTLLAEKAKTPSDAIDVLRRLDRFWRDLVTARTENHERERRLREQCLRTSRRSTSGILTARPGKSSSMMLEGTPTRCDTPQTARSLRSWATDRLTTQLSAGSLDSSDFSASHNRRGLSKPDKESMSGLKAGADALPVSRGVADKRPPLITQSTTVTVSDSSTDEESLPSGQSNPAEATENHSGPLADPATPKPRPPQRPQAVVSRTAPPAAWREALTRRSNRRGGDTGAVGPPKGPAQGISQRLVPPLDMNRVKVEEPTTVEAPSTPDASSFTTSSFSDASPPQLSSAPEEEEADDDNALRVTPGRPFRIPAILPPASTTVATVKASSQTTGLGLSRLSSYRERLSLYQPRASGGGGAGPCPTGLSHRRTLSSGKTDDILNAVVADGTSSLPLRGAEDQSRKVPAAAASGRPGAMTQRGTALPTGQPPSLPPLRARPLSAGIPQRSIPEAPCRHTVKRTTPGTSPIPDAQQLVERFMRPSTSRGGGGGGTGFDPRSPETTKSSVDRIASSAKADCPTTVFPRRAPSQYAPSTTSLLPRPRQPASRRLP